MIRARHGGWEFEFDQSGEAADFALRLGIAPMLPTPKVLQTTAKDNEQQAPPPFVEASSLQSPPPFLVEEVERASELTRARRFIKRLVTAEQVKFVQFLVMNGTATDDEARELVGAEENGWGGFLSALSKHAKAVELDLDDLVTKNTTFADGRRHYEYKPTPLLAEAIDVRKSEVTLTGPSS